MRCVIEFANYQKEQIYNSDWMPDYDKKDRLSIVNATIKEYLAGMLPAQDAMYKKQFTIMTVYDPIMQQIEKYIKK